MAVIKCPTNVSSITLSTSGVLTPNAAGEITCTSLEANALSQQGINGGNQIGAAKLISTASDGDIVISLPVLITSITINSVVYAVNGAVTPWGKVLSADVPAPAASIFLYQNFKLVRG